MRSPPVLSTMASVLALALALPATGAVIGPGPHFGPRDNQQVVLARVRSRDVTETTSSLMARATNPSGHDAVGGSRIHISAVQSGNGSALVDGGKTPTLVGQGVSGNSRTGSSNRNGSNKAQSGTGVGLGGVMRYTEKAGTVYMKYQERTGTMSMLPDKTTTGSGGRFNNNDLGTGATVKPSDKAGSGFGTRPGNGSGHGVTLYGSGHGGTDYAHVEKTATRSGGRSNNNLGTGATMKPSRKAGSGFGTRPGNGSGHGATFYSSGPGRTVYAHIEKTATGSGGRFNNNAGIGATVKPSDKAGSGFGTRPGNGSGHGGTVYAKVEKTSTGSGGRSSNNLGTGATVKPSEKAESGFGTLPDNGSGHGGTVYAHLEKTAIGSGGRSNTGLGVGTTVATVKLSDKAPSAGARSGNISGHGSGHGSEIHK